MMGTPLCVTFDIVLTVVFNSFAAAEADFPLDIAQMKSIFSEEASSE